MVSLNLALKRGSSRQGRKVRASAGSKFVQKTVLSKIEAFSSTSSTDARFLIDSKEAALSVA